MYNVYRTNPLLQGVRTQADLDSIDRYGAYALNFKYGPNPTNERVPQMASNCPFGYGYNSNAYNFQSGPNFINLNQVQNYHMQNAEKSFRGVPQQRPRYE